MLQLPTGPRSNEDVCDTSWRSYNLSYSLTTHSARSDAVLPLSTPIRDVDGRSIHEVFVPANTDVFVLIHHVNRDPSIWGPDVAIWKPERWLAPLPESVAKANIQGVYANT